MPTSSPVTCQQSHIHAHFLCNHHENGNVLAPKSSKDSRSSAQRVLIISANNISPSQPIESTTKGTFVRRLQPEGCHFATSMFSLFGLVSFLPSSSQLSSVTATTISQECRLLCPISATFKRTGYFTTRAERLAFSAPCTESTSEISS